MQRAFDIRPSVQHSARADLPAGSMHLRTEAPIERQGDVGWSDEDWQAAFDERAGSAEFDGGLSRTEAEELAEAEIRSLRERK